MIPAGVAVGDHVRIGQDQTEWVIVSFPPTAGGVSYAALTPADPKSTASGRWANLNTLVRVP